MSARLGSAALVCAGLLAVAFPARAQVVGRAATPAPGWIGISYEAHTTSEGTGTRTTAVITGVSEGSPAAAAGVEVGDVLVSINGAPRIDGLLGASRIQLRPGDAVELVIEREGRRRTFSVTAALRPASAPPPGIVVTLRADSMAEAMYREMESLRVLLVPGDPVGPRIVAVPNAPPQ